MVKIVRELTLHERHLLAPHFKPSTLLAAKIIENHTPFWLRPAMCAVVLGRTIYFRPNAYQAHTVSGLALLAHELTHVEQYLSGMSIVKYLWASRKGYHQNRYEIEAYAKGAAVYQALLHHESFALG